jgi:hypothetical protein
MSGWRRFGKVIQVSVNRMMSVYIITYSFYLRVSMMGCKLVCIKCHIDKTNFGIDGADKGIIPLTCLELFDRVDAKKAADRNVSFTVEVSYIEVRKQLSSWWRYPDAWYRYIMRKFEIC